MSRNHHAQYRISQEFDALVRLYLIIAYASGVRSVRNGLDQILSLPEAIAQAALKLCKLIGSTEETVE